MAEVSASTASAHLSRLVSTHLLVCLAQGRHRYYRLASADVAGLLENMMAMAGKSAIVLTTRTPVNLRTARTCYDHLAGEVAVAIYDFLLREAWIVPDGSALTPVRRGAVCRSGITLPAGTGAGYAAHVWTGASGVSIPVGAVGAALLQHGQRKGWFTLTPGFREVSITPTGRLALRQHFHLPL